MLRRLPYRPRLFVSALAGGAVALVMPERFETAWRAVIGWDAGIFVFLALIFVMAANATPETMRYRAQREGEGRWAFLALMAGAAIFSLFAMLGLLHQAHGSQGRLSVELALLAGTTILLSWAFAHAAFAVHYAHDFFSEPAGERKPGLGFPDAPASPDYWDFLYFSFVVGMTCQVSDVAVTSQPMRRLVLVHGVVSFLFNTIILALSINLAAGLL